MKTKRPSLMFVLGLAPKKIGGIEKFLRYFVHALDAAGWDAILCFDGEIAQDFRDFIAQPSVHLEFLPNQGDLGFTCAGPLWTLLRKHRPQIFVYAFHGVMRCFPWLARIAGAQRIFFNDHSSRAPGQVAAPLTLPKRLVGRLLTLPLTGILSVSEFTRGSGNAFGLTAAPATVIQNGIELPTIERERGRNFRQRYRIPDGAIVVTQICWMVEVKGVDTLLQAAALVLRTHPHVRFLLVGEGPKLAEYQAMATQLDLAQAVLFTGMLNNPTASGLFEATDLYCQPSRWQEASPLAVLEAMSFALPVIASNTGGLPELVAEGVSGLLVPVDDSAALARAISSLVDNPVARQSMGQAGYQSVFARHRIADVATRYVTLFLGKDATSSRDPGP